MLKSLSHYTCAAKSPFSANTNAKMPITVSRKCLERLCVKPMILMIFKGRLIAIGPAKFEAKPLPAEP